jgi:ParB/RepB/Spo0J family partition protein
VSTLRQLPPALLVPNDANPRTDLDVDDLVTSIRAVGLLQALLVVPIEPVCAAGDSAATALGRFRIIAGHRRHAAALQLDMQTVPCLVAADEGQASELVKILSENDLRTDLTNAQRTGLYQQLALLDWSVEAIAAAVVQPPERIRGALAVQRLAGSSREAALQAADDGTLDLADAAALSEFTDPKAVERIISRGKGWGFTHAVAEERAKQDRRTAAERLKAELVLAGARITTRPKNFGYGSREVEASTLLNTDGNRVDPQQAMTRPGFAVFVDAQASPPRSVVYCTDPDEWGYTRTRPTSYVSPAIAEAREREQTERTARAQALTVAAGVRRDFLATTWGTAKGAKALQHHAMRQAMTDPATISVPNGDATGDLLTRLAGCDLEAAATAGPDRLTRILVARWLTAAEVNLEDHIARRSWRAQQGAALSYMNLLTTHGYVLSDAEQHLHDDLTTATADQEPEQDPDEHDPDNEQDEDDSQDPAADEDTLPSHLADEQVA